MRPGDRLGVRGPFGRGFSQGENVLAVAGGIGAAPLLPLAEAGRVSAFLLGARSAAELPFRDRLGVATDLRLATDDGSAGHHGYVADLLADVDPAAFDAICVCGPEPMMAAVRDRLAGAGALERSFFSLHRHMKCGVGVCGSCAVDPDGLCVCRDGPVFSGPVVAASGARLPRPRRLRPAGRVRPPRLALRRIFLIACMHSSTIIFRRGPTASCGL